MGAIDVGAHYGVFTLLMAAKCGQRGRVIAFEPDPNVQDILPRNVRLTFEEFHSLVSANRAAGSISG
jgi:FkbM family methyltransferase